MKWMWLIRYHVLITDDDISFSVTMHVRHTIDDYWIEILFNKDVIECSKDETLFKGFDKIWYVFTWHFAWIVDDYI